MENLKTLITLVLGIATMPIVLAGFLWEFSCDRFSDGQQLYRDFLQWLF